MVCCISNRKKVAHWVHTTRAKLNRLLDEGDITPQQVDSFHEAVLSFLTSALDYAIKKLPLKEPLLKHSTFVDAWQRAESDIGDVLYFVERVVFSSNYCLSS